MSPILNQGAPPAQTQPVQNPQQQPAPEAEEKAPGITPSEGEAINMFLANGLNIVHDKKVEKIIKGFVDSPDSANAVSDLTLTVISRLEGGMEKNKMRLPMEFVAQIANVLMGDIIKVAEGLGMKAMTDDDKYASFSMAVSKYLDQAYKTGKITKEQLQEYSEKAKGTPEGKKMMSEYGAEFEAAPPGQPAGQPQGQPKPGIINNASGGMT